MESQRLNGRRANQSLLGCRNSNGVAVTELTGLATKIRNDHATKTAAAAATATIEDDKNAFEKGQELDKEYDKRAWHHFTDAKITVCPAFYCQSSPSVFHGVASSVECPQCHPA
jgi:hypothetical protein